MGAREPFSEAAQLGSVGLGSVAKFKPNTSVCLSC